MMQGSSKACSSIQLGRQSDGCLGLVRRERAIGDRRAYAVTLTDLGRRRLAEAAAIATRVMGELLEGFDPDEERQLNTMLQRIIDRAGQRRSPW